MIPRDFIVKSRVKYPKKKKHKMSKTCLIILCPNGRRETIKASPNGSMLQVLEEACAKQDLKPEDFDLWHYKKCLDLSLPIRFANLPNNALLELHPAKNSRKDCAVTIALQLETGERHMKEFTPSATLFDVILKCLQKDSLNSQENVEPVCIYMRQKITGDAIKTVTLRSLGLTQGTAIIRLLYRKPEQLENQAHVSNPLTAPVVVEPVSESKYLPSSSSLPTEKDEKFSDFKKETCSSNELPSENNGECINLSCNKDFSSTEDKALQFKEEKQDQIKVEATITAVDQSEKMDCDEERTSSNLIKNETIEMDHNQDTQEELEEIGDINYIGERHAVLYSLDDITEQKKADLPDEFFELTVNDVRYLLETYKKERMLLENQPLLTKEQRERQILQKLACYSQTIIRIYFPERLVLQAVFNTTDTVQTVCNFLRDFLENKDVSFYLYTTPPKEKLSNTKNLLECMLVPAAVVYFGCDIQLPRYLATRLQQQKSDPRAAALAASESRKSNSPNIESDVSNDRNVSIKAESSSENRSLSGNDSCQSPVNLPKPGKIPKWMKLSKQ